MENVPIIAILLLVPRKIRGFIAMHTHAVGRHFLGLQLRAISNQGKVLNLKAQKPHSVSIHYKLRVVFPPYLIAFPGEGRFLPQILDFSCSQFGSCLLASQRGKDWRHLTLCDTLL